MILQTTSSGSKQAGKLNFKDVGRVLIIGDAPTFDVIKSGIVIRALLQPIHGMIRRRGWQKQLSNDGAP
jgi:hypothetical protein